MKKPPLKTIRDIAGILHNPPSTDVTMICDTIVRMCEDFKTPPMPNHLLSLGLWPTPLGGKVCSNLRLSQISF